MCRAYEPHAGILTGSEESKSKTSSTRPAAASISSFVVKRPKLKTDGGIALCHGEAQGAKHMGRLGDTSFAVSPIPDHAFFEQPVLQHLFGKRLLEVAHLVAQLLDLTRGRLARGIARKPFPASLEERLRPAVIQALGNPFPAAWFCDAVLTTQARYHDPDLSSAEYCLRVLRRISRTVRSAVSLERIDSCLIYGCLRPGTGNRGLRECRPCNPTALAVSSQRRIVAARPQPGQERASRLTSSRAASPAQSDGLDVLFVRYG